MRRGLRRTGGPACSSSRGRRGPDQRGRVTFPMDTQQISAPSRASSGVVHDNSRHTSRFTVVGNHLTQHRELSLTAIGLAAHVQSLPAGVRIGIKDLAGRFPESEARIAAALRELEAHGYLRRTRTRLANGRIVTRTVSCNQPSDQRRTDALPGRDCPQRTVRPPVPVRSCSEPEADDAHPARSGPAPSLRPVVSPRPCSYRSRPSPPRPSSGPPPTCSPGCTARTPACCFPRRTWTPWPQGSSHGWSARSAPTPYSTPLPANSHPKGCAVLPVSSLTGSPPGFRHRPRSCPWPRSRPG